MSRLAGILTVFLTALTLSATEVRVYPGEYVYVYEVEPQRGLYSVILQNIAILHPEDGSLTVEGLTIEAMRSGRVRDALHLDESDLDKAAARMEKYAKAGLLEVFDFAFQTSRYLPAETGIAGTRNLTTSQALIVGQAGMMLHGVPDTIRVTARLAAPDGSPREVVTELAVRTADEKTAYRFPLRGTWFVAAGPNFEGTHRWALNQEFALDVVRTGGPEGLTFDNDGTEMEHYFGFGADVIAVADGVVVDVQGGIEDDSRTLRKPGESDEAYMQRGAAYQMKLLQDSPKAIGGNYVMIRHSNGIHSFYGHLKRGSVRVEKGAAVKRGAIIAALGGSGNSTEPHLHFHFCEGADPLYSRSVPARFENLRVVDRGNEPLLVQGGWIVTTVEK
jgi:murein DD-endopeptidase MepM/ murein hydrolase activator NlpD